MATPNVGILTTAGKALIDKVNSGQAKISFSKIVFSSMDNSQLSDMQVKALTAIAPQDVVVSSPETTLDTNSGETRIRATGTNEKLADGVYVKTYGVFAKDDTGSEILYGVTVSPNSNYFPAYDGVTPQAVTYSYKTVIQETSNITMTNSNDVYVSQEDLTEAIAAIPKPDLSNYATNRQLATKADDSKVVHSTDMRKPASDVAGIEEVNAKQDKIGYTPADDSKVVHNSAIDPSVMFKRTLTADDDVLALDAGIYCAWGVSPKNYPTSVNNYARVVVKKFSGLDVSTGNIIVEVLDAFNNKMLNIYQGGPPAWSGWHVPNSNTMASKSDVSTATANKADDSKVAHLSGANNFDTVPTVNNNPLLLASSLPSDLARTGSDQEFTGKNTFDIAPTDKTTGKPYITKDGVPSDVARTSQQTNFTAGLKSGGVDVATAADLKSVEASAWRLTALPDVPAVKGIHMLYKIDVANNLLYIVLNGEFKSVDSSDANELLLADLSAIVKGISGVDIKAMNSTGVNFYYHGQNSYNDYKINFGYSGTKLMLKSPYTDAPMIRTSSGVKLSILYGSTIKYTELV
jgi:hypothetical protein|nr:MAG TPA: tail collar fiber protein [Caudoviricetes sp.]